MYLKVLPKILMRSLRRHLNYPLKKKIEQDYIRLRLQLLDQHFFLILIDIYGKPIQTLVHNNNYGQ